jgi:hypothetical protein
VELPAEEWKKRLLLASLEDFVGGVSGAFAVPVGVVQKIEILVLIEKNSSVVYVAVFKSNSRDTRVLKGIPKVLESCARCGDIRRLGEKRRVDGRAVGNQKDHQIKAILA